MPKISEFPEAEALTGDEAIPVARTVGGVAETVRVPLSLLLALLDGASFADLAGAPGDNAALAAALAARAPLDSPALAGTPTAPTAAGGTSTAQLATCAFVMGAIAALVGAAPENLNSFQEFADALGEDPNFATTILDQLAAKADAAATTAALAIKAPAASPTLTGAIGLAGSVRGGVTPVVAGAIDCSAGNWFSRTLAGNQAFTFANVPAGAYGFTLSLTYASGAPSWPASVAWPDGEEPDWSPGKWLVMFATDDGGAHLMGAALGPF